MIRDLYDWVVITFWECVISEIKSKRWVPCKPTVFKHIKVVLKFSLFTTEHNSVVVIIATFISVMVLFIPLVVISYYIDLYVWRYQQRFPEAML